MAEPNRSAAGAPLALLILAGALIGAAFGQPTIGFLVGVALGTALAITAWLRDKRRIGE